MIVLYHPLLYCGVTYPAGTRIMLPADFEAKIVDAGNGTFVLPEENPDLSDYDDAPHGGNAALPVGDDIPPGGNAALPVGNDSPPSGNAVLPVGNDIPPSDAIPPAGAAAFIPEGNVPTESAQALPKKNEEPEPVSIELDTSQMTFGRGLEVES